MKQVSIRLLFIVIIVTSLFSSCVTSKEHEALQGRFKDCGDENATLKEQNRKLSISNTEQKSEIKNLELRIKKLNEDMDEMKRENSYMQKAYDQLKNTYDLMLKENQNKLSGKDEETRKILAELQATQENLFKQEDELIKLGKELALRKDNLDKLNAQLMASQQSIEEKEKRLHELESILFKKDSVVNALKNTVSDALLGFVNEGLSVDIRNGKVYVSLEEKLLFASGRYEVGKTGVDALKKLAKVLENDPEINILIEGHTDNVPYNGSGQIKDNWDLSVMRATAIVKILINNSSINPERLMVAGRSEFIPIDKANSTEARAKNRRTEIILTPKLDELFQILEMN